MTETRATCPDEDVLALFVDGQLDAAAEDTVKAHIGVCDACRELIAASSRDLFARTDPYSERDVLAGKYRLEEELGSGGMGRVYRARQLALERTVAIKLLHPHLLRDAGMVRRFEREARAVASLRSPHAVKVLDIDWLPTGAPFIVMEYLEGCDLAVLVDREGPLSPPRAVRYMLEAGEALAEAHRNGIIHRDVKPQNLFLANEGPRGVVKVLDFGLAKVLNRRSPLGTESLTLTGHVLGSPYYMSPEQIRSDAIDLRTDVWSIGATLYMLLCGHAPFVGPNLAILRARILNESPKPMAHYRAGVSDELEAVVRRCLRANPEERWATIDEFAAALRNATPEDETATPGAPANGTDVALASSATAFADTTATPPLRSPRRWIVPVAGACLALAMSATLWPSRRASDPLAKDATHPPAPAKLATSLGEVAPPRAADPVPAEPSAAVPPSAAAPTFAIKAAAVHGGRPLRGTRPQAEPSKPDRAEPTRASLPVPSASAPPIDPFALPRTQ